MTEPREVTRDHTAHWISASDEKQAEDGLVVETLCGILWGRPNDGKNFYVNKMCPQCLEMGNAIRVAQNNVGWRE